MSLPMGISAETGAGAGLGSLDHLNDPDKRNRVATRSLDNLQQEISAYRAPKMAGAMCTALASAHMLF